MNFTYKRTYRGPLQAVIFDWAGTIVDYGSRAPAMVFVETFQQFDVDISLAEARAPMGMAKKDHIRAITRLPGVAGRWQDAHGRPPTEDDITAMYNTFIPLQLEALVDYAELIPGMLETVGTLREMGLKIGTNTGYNRDMVDILLAEAREQGFEPDSTVCTSEVPAGRPEPWMSLLNAQQMRVFPMAAVVKIDDTLPGIEEGLNVGMWTIGVTKTGNELGLSEAETDALPPDELQTKLASARWRMHQAGAHYVIEGVWDVPKILDKINRRLGNGETP